MQIYNKSKILKNKMSAMTVLWSFPILTSVTNKESFMFFQEPINHSYIIR